MSGGRSSCTSFWTLRCPSVYPYGCEIMNLVFHMEHEEILCSNPLCAFNVGRRGIAQGGYR